MMMMMVHWLLLLHRIGQGTEVVERVEQAALAARVEHRQASVAVEAVAEQCRLVLEVEEEEAEVGFCTLD